MQSEVSWTNTVCLRFHEVLRVVKFIETENGMVVSWGWRKGKMGSSCSTGTELIEDDEKFWRWIHNNGNALNATELYT